MAHGRAADRMRAAHCVADAARDPNRDERYIRGAVALAGTRRNRFARAVMHLCVALAMIEVGARLVSAPFAGPCALLYGAPWCQHRSDATSHVFDAGAASRSVPTAKPVGVRRVLTLGASETFGSADRDDDTYPYYLQAALDRRVGPRRFDVVAVGGPHADSEALVALLSSDGVGLHPDVVAVYAGMEDSERAVYDRLYGDAWRDDPGHLLSVSLAKRAYHAAFPPSGRIAVTDAMVRAAIDRYLGNLDRIAAASRGAGARMVVVTQQARALVLDAAALHGVTYDAEARFMATEIAAIEPRFDGAQERLGAVLVVHARLMKATREWATRNAVTMVDGVGRLDAQRDLVGPGAHLAPAARKALAKALAAAIVGLPALVS